MHTFGYAVRALGLAAALGCFSHTSHAAGLGFATDDYFQRVDGVQSFSDRGESVFLAHKYSIRSFVAPYALIDGGYVLASESSPKRSYEIDGATLSALQLRGLLPNPLPKQQIGLGAYAFGYMAWELLALFAVTALLVVRVTKRTSEIAETATASSEVNLATLLQSDKAPANETADLETVKVWLIPEGGTPLAASYERISSPGGCIVGRAPDSGIVIADKTVSKRHARLSFDATGRLLIEDLESANGSWKNGVRISREVLSSGDAVWFGNAEFTVDIHESQEGGAATFVQTPGSDTAEKKSGNELDRPLVLSGIDHDGHVIQFWLQAGGEERVWTLGRKPGAADLVIPYQRISATHAQIRFRPGHGFEIRDLGSANGTKTDGQEVGQDYVPLAEVRKISFGDLQVNANLG
jgi:pSer/pThr/pTyr-binding forkhead associated (FHA) protein